MNIIKLSERPKIIGLCANANEGKTNTIYYILKQLQHDYSFNVHTYGLRLNFPKTEQIHSVEELEQIKNSIIIIDEMFSLFDLDNRKIKSQIENTLRLIFHNNNILLLCGLGENFKKFIAAKLNAIIFKKITFKDMINGSGIKNVAMNYKGNEAGSTILNLEINEALVYDGLHYHKITVDYMKEYDTKLKNVDILTLKSVRKIVLKKRTKKGKV